MTLRFEELRVLKNAEAIADKIWQNVIAWDPFIRETVGKQLTRSVDSIGANIAEAYGRFSYGEKLQFLYYARGSLFETKYWLNRTLARDLMPTDQIQDYASQLSEIARQLNAFVASLKNQRRGSQSKTKEVSEASTDYVTVHTDGVLESLFSEEEVEWFHILPNI